MRRLNYKQLEYFWAVGREGSVTRAARALRVSQPAVSAQLRELERALGERLLEKSGRTLVLTEMGRLVFRYADEIFALGQELTETVRGQPSEQPLRLVVGMVQSLPKLVVHRLIAPALRMDRPVRLVVREDQADRLFAELALHTIDLVLSDTPLPAAMGIKGFNHVLGECGVTVLGAEVLARRYRRGFPGSLDGAPFLLPTANTALRRGLDRWFDECGVRPTTVAEVEDSAVLKVLGHEGAGLFAIPTIVEREVVTRYRVRVVGRIEAVRERFYAVSAERRIAHPAVAAITHEARSRLFA